MSIEESLKIVPKGEIALVEWDLVGEKVNKLSSPIMVRFKEILEEIKASDYKAVVLISRKKNIFIAGADINEIQGLKTKEAFAEAAGEGQKILNMIEDLPIPVVAAIHGACVGGGCELVMACDHRICSEDSSTRIGLPEVRLGIIPGFGGCVRMPRMIGLQNSLDIILAGKSVNAKKAKKIGLVDAVVHAEILEEQAMALAKDAISQGKRTKVFKPRNKRDQLLESFVGRNIVYSQAKKTVMKQTGGHYPAPLKALEVVKDTYGFRNREKALAREMEGFCEVAVTDVSKNLIHVFFMMKEVKKKTGVASDVKGRTVKHVGVLGAGTMGGGIAFAAADKGIDSRLKDISWEAIGKGYEAAHKIWQKQVKRRRLKPKQLRQKMDLISGGLDYAGFGQMDVVIEAIVEDMEIKKKVIGETAANCPEDCVIATNTSSLSVTEMAKGHPRPENFGGMHFFNPVDRMPLVEVIRGEKTSDETTATIFALAKKMGKTPVVVKDGPGFLVNRLLLPYLGEAAFLLAEGMSVEKLDKYLKSEFGMPMGPCRLLDEIGIDVGCKVLKIFSQSFGSRIETSPLMETLEKSGLLGKKGGKGFYNYDDKGKEDGVNTSVYSTLGLSQPTDPYQSKECIERCVFTMINEASLAMIEDRIVETPQEVDLAMIMGTGFPPFRGGLLKYADSLGSKYICDELEMYASRYGARFKPCKPLENMANTERKFYDIAVKKKMKETETKEPTKPQATV